MPYRRSKTDIHTLPQLEEFRNELRKRLTPAEASFWDLVKNSRLDGRKFRRQHSVGNYILDFYCPSEKLAVELDGARHFRDRERLKIENERLTSRNMTFIVIRFENRMVFEEREWVADVIRSNFRFGPPVELKSFAGHASERTTPSAEAAATPPS